MACITPKTHRDAEDGDPGKAALRNRIVLNLRGRVARLRARNGQLRHILQLLSCPAVTTTAERTSPAPRKSCAWMSLPDVCIDDILRCLGTDDCTNGAGVACRLLLRRSCTLCDHLHIDGVLLSVPQGSDSDDESDSGGDSDGDHDGDRDGDGDAAGNSVHTSSAIPTRSIPLPTGICLHLFANKSVAAKNERARRDAMRDRAGRRWCLLLRFLGRERRGATVAVLRLHGTICTIAQLHALANACPKCVFDFDPATSRLAMGGTARAEARGWLMGATEVAAMAQELLDSDAGLGWSAAMLVDACRRAFCDLEDANFADGPDNQIGVGVATERAVRQECESGQVGMNALVQMLGLAVQERTVVDMGEGTRLAADSSGGAVVASLMAAVPTSVPNLGALMQNILLQARACAADGSQDESTDSDDDMDSNISTGKKQSDHHCDHGGRCVGEGSITGGSHSSDSIGSSENESWPGTGAGSAPQGCNTTCRGPECRRPRPRQLQKLVYRLEALREQRAALLSRLGALGVLPPPAPRSLAHAAVAIGAAQHLAVVCASALSARALLDRADFTLSRLSRAAVARIEHLWQGIGQQLRQSAVARWQGDRCAQETAWWALPLQPVLSEALAMSLFMETAMPAVVHLHGLQLTSEAWSCIDSLMGLELCRSSQVLFESEPTVGQLLESPLLRVEKYRTLAMGLSNIVSDWLSLD